MWKGHSACSVVLGRIRKCRTLIESSVFQFQLPKDRFTDLWSEVSTSINGEITEDAEVECFSALRQDHPVQSLAKPLTIWEVLGQITKSGCASLCVYKVEMLSLMLRCSYFNISKSGCSSQSLSARWQRWHRCLPMLGILGVSCVHVAGLHVYWAWLSF